MPGGRPARSSGEIERALRMVRAGPAHRCPRPSHPMPSSYNHPAESCRAGERQPPSGPARGTCGSAPDASWHAVIVRGPQSMFPLQVGLRTTILHVTWREKLVGSLSPQRRRRSRFGPCVQHRTDRVGIGRHGASAGGDGYGLRPAAVGGNGVACQTVTRESGSRAEDRGNEEVSGTW